MSAFAATLLGLGAVGQVLSAPTAEAYNAPTWTPGPAWTTDAPGVDQAGASMSTNPSIGVSVASNQITGTPQTVPATDDTALYGIDGYSYGNIAKISTTDASRTQQFAAHSNGSASDMSTLAIDSGVSGLKNNGFYTWFWGNQGGSNGAPAGRQPIFFYEPGQTKASAIYYVPLPRYFNHTTGNDYYSGGVVNQKTGMLLLGQGECDSLGNAGTARFSAFDPATGTTYFSGQLKPATASDNLWTAGNACGGQSYIASGAAVTADGDFVILVNGTSVAIPATSPINPTGQNIPAGNNNVSFLVKVHPSFSSAPWTYSIVTMVWNGTNAGGNSNGVTNFFGRHHYGTAFVNGYLYVATDTWIHAINPLTGVVKNVGQTNNNRTAANPAAQDGNMYDLASTQTAPSVVGTVYQDSTGSGTFSTSNPPLAGVKVAIYEMGGRNNYTTPTLIGSQATDGQGNYTFLVPDVGPGVQYYVRVVQPVLGTAANPVNAVVTSVAALTDTYNGTSNPATITCGDGSTIAGGAGTLNGAKCQGVGPDGTSKSAPLGSVGSETFTPGTTSSVYAVVNMNTSWAQSQVDFTLSAATLSFGDAAAGPATTPTGAPVHNNTALQPVQLGATAPLAGAQTAPSTTDNHATDDGVTITSKLPDGAGGFTSTQIPLTGTVMAATKTYDSLTADVVANNGYPCSGAQPCYVSAWTTGAGNNTWTTTPKWPAGAPTSTGAGNLTAPFQFQATGSVGATPQTVQMRFDASTAPQTSATNGTTGNGTYQSTTAGANFTTSGEIEDYTFKVSDAVYRPAAKTTGGTGSGFVVGPLTPTIDSVSTTPKFGPAIGAGTTAQTINVKPPASGQYYVKSVGIYDTETGALVQSVPVGAGTLTSAGGTFSYTPAMASDVTILATFGLSPAACTITGPTGDTVVNANATVSVKCVDSGGAAVPGADVTFTATPTGSTWVPATGGDQCTTGTDGTCTVQLTSSTQTTFNVGATTPSSTGTLQAKAADGVTLTVPVKFVAGAVVPGNSTLTIDNADYKLVGTPTSTPPGETHTISVTLKDAGNNTVLVDHSADLTANLPAGVAGSTWSFDSATGVYTMTLTSTTAGSLPITVDYSGTTVGAAPGTTVFANFKPGPGVVGPITCPDGSTGGSSLTANPATGVSVEGGTSAVTVTLQDEYCNPLPGVTVGIASNPASTTALFTDATHTTPATTIQVVTDTGGQATVTLQDKTAEIVTVQATAPATVLATPMTTTVQFVAGAPSVGPFECEAGKESTNLSANPYDNGTALANVPVTSGSSTVRAYVTDKYCNPVEGATVTISQTGAATLTPSSGWVTNSNGIATATLKDSAAETVTLTGAVTLAGGVQGAMPTVPAPLQVTFMAGGPSNTCSSTATTCTNLVVTPMPVSSTVPGMPVSVDATPGAATATATITDYDGNLLSGVDVTFTSDSATAYFVDPATGNKVTHALTGSDGKATVWVVDTKAHVVMVSAATSGLAPINKSPQPIEFVAGTPDVGPDFPGCGVGETGSNLSASPRDLTGAPANLPVVTGSSTVTALVTDQYCNPVAGVTVTFGKDGSATLTPTAQTPLGANTATTGADGTATATLKDDKAETVTLTASITEGALTASPSPLTVTFVAGPPSNTCDAGVLVCTNLAVTPAPVSLTVPGTGVPVDAAPGSASAIATITDVKGNPVAGVDVTFTADSATAKFVDPADGTTAVTHMLTGADGKATVWVVDTKAEQVKVSATTPTLNPVNGSPQPLQFVAGTPSVGPDFPDCTAAQIAAKQFTSLTADPADAIGAPANVPVSTGSSTVTALVTDKYCNPVAGVTVTFGKDGSATLTPTAQAPLGANTATTGADGTATATLTDAKAETVTLTSSIAQGNMVTIPSPLKVTFAAGVPSNTCDAGVLVCTNLVVTPTPVSSTVPGTGVSVDAAPGAATAKATITDAHGNLLAGVDVTFNANSSTATFIDPATGLQITGPVKTGADGTVTVWVVDTKAGVVQVSASTSGLSPITGSPQPVKFVAGDPSVGPFDCQPGEVGTNMSAQPVDQPGAPANVSVDGGTSLVTVLVTDDHCNPVEGAIVTVTPTGAATLTPTSTWTTNANGIVTATLKDSTAETVTLTGTVPIKGTATALPTDPAPLKVTFQAGGPANTCDAGVLVCTNLVVTPTPVSSTVPGTGVSVDAAPGAATATATITDAHGNLLAGVDVTFTASSSTAYFVDPATGLQITGPVKTDANGKVTVWVVDTVAQQVDVSASTSGLQPIAGSPQPIKFVAGAPDVGPDFPDCPAGAASTNLSAVPSDAPGAPASVSVAGGSSTVTAYVTDKYCNPVPGIVVTFAKDKANAVLTPTANAPITPSTAVTGDDGKATASLTDTKAETVTLSATIPTETSTAAALPTSPDPLTVTFQAGGPANTCDVGVAVCTNLVVTPTPVSSTVPGTPVKVDAAPGSATATATITDAQGNLLAGVDVTFTSTGSAHFVDPATGATITGPVKTGADGKVTVWVVDTVAQQVDVSASTSGLQPIAGSPQPIKFVAGAPDVGPDFPQCTAEQIAAKHYTHLEATPSDAATTPANLPVGTGASIVTALVTDQYCNAVEGATVTIDNTGSAVLTPGTGGYVTGPDGTVTATLTDTKAEKVTLTATTPTDASAASPMVTIPAPLTVTFTTLGEQCENGTVLPGEACSSYTLSTWVITPVVASPDPTMKDWRLANGNDAYVGTFTAIDQYGNKLDGLDPARMRFPITATTPALASNVTVSAITAGPGAGQYQVRFTSSVADASYKAAIEYNDDWTAIGDPLPIPFKDWIDCTTTPIDPACVVDFTKSSFVVSPVVDPADPAQTNWASVEDANGYTATFTAVNSDGIKLKGLDPSVMAFTPSSPNVSKTAVTPVGDGTGGQYATTLTSTRSGSGYTVSLKYNNQTVYAFIGSSISTSVTALPIPFKPGAPKEGPFTCDDGTQGSNVTANPTSVTVGGTSTVTALVTDQYCNPVPGVWVWFTPDGAATVSPQEAQTDANGIATTKLTDNAVQTVTVTATILSSQSASPQQGKPDGTATVKFNAVAVVVQTGGSITASVPYGALAGASLAIVAGLWLAARRRAVIMTDR